jgi:hypothetical protein
MKRLNSVTLINSNTVAIEMSYITYNYYQQEFDLIIKFLFNLCTSLVNSYDRECGSVAV